MCLNKKLTTEMFFFLYKYQQERIISVINFQVGGEASDNYYLH